GGAFAALELVVPRELLGQAPAYAREARGVAEGLEEGRLAGEVAEQAHLRTIGGAVRVGDGVDVDPLGCGHDLDLGLRRRGGAQGVAEEVLPELVGAVSDATDGGWLE